VVLEDGEDLACRADGGVFGFVGKVDEEGQSSATQERSQI
jgi:hypothetical protein